MIGPNSSALAVLKATRKLIARRCDSLIKENDGLLDTLKRYVSEIGDIDSIWTLGALHDNGAPVVLVGLEQSPELNGARGVVEEFKDDVTRYVVRLDGAGAAGTAGAGGEEARRLHARPRNVRPPVEGFGGGDGAIEERVAELELELHGLEVRVIEAAQNYMLGRDLQGSHRELKQVQQRAEQMYLVLEATEVPRWHPHVCRLFLRRKWLRSRCKSLFEPRSGVCAVVVNMLADHMVFFPSVHTRHVPFEGGGAGGGGAGGGGAGGGAAGGGAAGGGGGAWPECDIRKVAEVCGCSELEAQRALTTADGKVSFAIIGILDTLDAQTKHAAGGGGEQKEGGGGGGDGGDKDICVICMDKLKNHALVPCGHLCLCRDCTSILRRQDGARCPICRTEITSALEIFG